MSITSGSNLPNGFTLYVNAPAGTFNPQQEPFINWNNQGGGPSGSAFGSINADGSQISGVVTPDLFSQAVTSNQTVLVSVTMGETVSNALTFLIVPPPSVAGAPPGAFIGQPYSATLLQDGTAPFQTSVNSGSLPPGITFNGNGNGLTGTPVAPPGLYTYQAVATDFWGNPVTVKQATQSVGTPPISPVVSSAGTAYPYGTLTNLQVALPANAQPAYAANVQFREGNILLGAASIVPGTGVATLPGIFLSLGGHSITATYLGDTNWQAAGSPATVITVGQATPTFQLTGNPFSGTYGGAMSAGTITVVGAASPGVAPTGTLALSSGQVQLGTFNVNGPINLNGIQLTATLQAGAGTIRFSYSGDATYTTANQGATLNIARATPTTSLVVSPNPVGYRQNATFTAGVISPTRGTPTGTVTFLDNGTAIAGGTVNLTNGSATFSTTTLLPGRHNITFGYAGDTNFTGTNSNGQTLMVNAPSLTITTTSLGVGTASQPYSTTIAASGGVPPYTFSSQGLPGGLNLNPQTGALTGAVSNSGNFSITFIVTDSAGTLATRMLALQILTPPVRISPFAALPDGTVGVGYSGTVGAIGGVSPIAFSITSGSVPPGLSFQSSGLLTGTPTAAGKYSFTVTVSDAANTSDSKDFTVTINPAPLSMSGGSFTVPVGSPVNSNLACSGGVPSYSFSVSGGLPPGVSFGNCALSGTPTATGTYTVRITVRDAAGTSITKDITITVTAPGLILTGTALPNGQVGAAYSASISATGGVTPIRYSGSGLPGGLSLSSSGAITGTPTTAGQFSFQVTATDSSSTTAPASAAATFSITILPQSLGFGTVSLPDGVVGVAYSGSVTGVGGATPYSFSFTGLPDGLSGSSGGSVTGTPTTAGTFTAGATITDSAGAHATQTYTIKIAPPSLAIATMSAPDGTVGTAYSATFAATGGTAPYTFTATGQPSTLTMSTGGTLSGTPAAAGTVSLTVSVKDANGLTASKTFTFTISLPAPSTLSFGGISTTVNPAQQPRVTVSLTSPYPVDVVVTLTLTMQPVSGPPDPAVVFSTGGVMTTITIPAGSLNGATDVGVQTGTVAGTITITAKLTAGGTDVTPSPAPNRTIQVAASAPVLTSVTATRTSGGFTITVIGYVTDREITTANFTFTGTNLGTTGLPVTADSIFATWFGGSSSAPFGGQFSYVQTFTVNGSNGAISSVSVTLTNKVGTSNSLSATLN